MTAELKQSEQNLLKAFGLLTQYQNHDQVQSDDSFVKSIAKLRMLELRLEAQKRKHTRNLANNKMLKKDEAHVLKKREEILSLETYVKKMIGADHAKADHAKADHAEADHAEADHAKADHAEADHAEADHAEADHAKADHAKSLFDISSIRLPKPHYTPNSQLRNIRNHIKIIRDDIQKSELQKRKAALATAASIIDKTTNQKFDHLLAALRVREATYVRRVSQGKEYEGFKTKNAISATEKLAATREMIAFVRQAKDNFSKQAIITEVTDNTFSKAATTGTLGKIASEVTKTINAIIEKENDRRRIAALTPNNNATEQPTTFNETSSITPVIPREPSNGNFGPGSPRLFTEAPVNTPRPQTPVNTPRPQTPVNTPRPQTPDNTPRPQAPDKTTHTFSEFLRLIRDNKEENKTLSNLKVVGDMRDNITGEDRSTIEEIHLDNIDFRDVNNLHEHVDLLKSLNLARTGSGTVHFSDAANTVLAELNARDTQGLWS
jgi:hypothetical protein